MSSLLAEREGCAVLVAWFFFYRSRGYNPRQAKNAAEREKEIGTAICQTGLGVARLGWILNYFEQNRRDSETYNGVPIAKLRSLFAAATAEMPNWKTAIRVEVQPGWEQSMADAIEFHVGGKCCVAYQRGSASVPNAGRVAVITNPGYYVNIGA